MRLVLEAEEIVSSTGAHVVVFSGWSPRGGRSEAEQMRDAWHGPYVELVVEPTAATTAQNAARTLPLLLERGIGAAVVVCAPPHLARTRFFFRTLYRGSGVDVTFRAARIAPTARAVLWELLAFPFVPAQLHAARAELAGRLP
jgi:uncharacterized SAM-binding protein YcdF (DUF218 family)